MLKGEFRTHYDGQRNVYYYFDQNGIFTIFTDQYILFSELVNDEEIKIKDHIYKYNSTEWCDTPLIRLLKNYISEKGLDLESTYGVSCVAGDVDVDEGERVFLTSYTDMYDPHRITYANYSIPFNFSVSTLAKLAGALPIDEEEYLIVERVKGTLATHLRY